MPSALNRNVFSFAWTGFSQGDVGGMLNYCLKVCLELLQHRQFRNVVLRCLVELYRGLQTADYVSMCQCLIFLDDPLAVADILDKLIHGADHDGQLMAYQIAFDLYESATQQFLGRVLQALKPTHPPALTAGGEGTFIFSDSLAPFLVHHLFSSFVTHLTISKADATSLDVGSLDSFGSLP